LSTEGAALRRQQWEQLENNNCKKIESWGGKQDQSQTSQAQPSEKKKWQYGYRPFGKNSLKK
jgi:hypothetical protein